MLTARTLDTGIKISEAWQKLARSVDDDLRLKKVTSGGAVLLAGRSISHLAAGVAVEKKMVTQTPNLPSGNEVEVGC